MSDITAEFSRFDEEFRHTRLSNDSRSSGMHAQFAFDTCASVSELFGVVVSAADFHGRYLQIKKLFYTVYFGVYV
jgi:hypothetical protein